MPGHVTLVWKNWKRRPKQFIGKPHPIRFHCNSIEGKAHLDIVYLLGDWIQHLIVNGEYDDKKPLFDVTSDTYQTHVKDIFDYAFEITDDEKWLDYSSHSVRYSAVMWARQCGADLQIIRRVGRWASLEILMGYMGEGEQDMRIANLLDGIQKIIVFKTVSDATTTTEFRVENSQAV